MRQIIYVVYVLITLHGVLGLEIEKRPVFIQEKPVIRSGMSKIYIKYIKEHPVSEKSKILVKKMDGKKRHIEYRINKLEYDEKNGTYTFTFWGEEGKRRQMKFEYGNKIKARVVTSVNYHQNDKLYEYTYRIYISKKSPQKLRSFSIPIDPNLIKSIIKNKGKQWFAINVKPDNINVKSGRLSVMVNYLRRTELTAPGESVTLKITSKYPPWPYNAYLCGETKYFHMEEFAVYYKVGGKSHDITFNNFTLKEGVKGFILAPKKNKITKENFKEYFKAIIMTGREWGWIRKKEYRVFSSLLTRGKSLGPVLKKYKQMKKKKSFEPEVISVFKYLTRLENEK